MEFVVFVSSDSSFLHNVYKIRFELPVSYIHRYPSEFTMRFHILAATTMKMAAFWIVAPRSFVHVNRRFGGA
jgi:hypothetical protein